MEFYHPRFLTVKQLNSDSFNYQVQLCEFTDMPSPLLPFQNFVLSDTSEIDCSFELLFADDIKELVEA